MDITSLFNEHFPSNASDVHLSPGIRPAVRINGELSELEDYPVLSPAETEAAAKFLLTDFQFSKLLQNGDVDISRFIGTDNIRARINVYRQRGSFSIAVRLNSMQIKTMDELGLPPAVLELCKLQRGLVLITGPTGVGKTTTIASMINWMNHNIHRHIITIEDPIEFMFRHDKCMINQRQVGTDATSFASALKSVLRQDPDVIVVGEMRDLESIATALTAAETGHLVISSLHTIGATKTVDRIIDVFPSVQQQQIRIQLSMVLQGIVSQQLLPRKDGSGRVVATEVMLAVPAVRNMIRSEKTHQLQNVILTNLKLGMQSMDGCLLELFKNDVIDEESVIAACTDPDYIIKELDSIKFRNNIRKGSASNNGFGNP